MKNVNNTEANSNKNECKTTMEKLVETTINNLQWDCRGDMERSIQNAIREVKEECETLTNQSTKDQELLNKIWENVEAKLPDEFEYEIDHDMEYGWTLVVKSGCPACGSESIQNGTIEVSNQWVAMDEDEDGNTISKVDDSMNQEIMFLSCGCCGEVLVNKNEDDD